MLNKIKKEIYILLKKSEKWTKTDMIYLAKGSFWLTLGQGISSLSSFLLALAFANLLPKETYGNYKYILSIVGVLSIATLSGINTSLTRSIARGFEGSMSIALKTKIKWGVLGGIASLILAGYYWMNNNTVFTFAFLISAIFIPFMDSFGVYGPLFSGRKDFKTSTKYKIIAQIIPVLLIIITIFFSKNILLILITYFSANTLVRMIIYKISIKKLKNKEIDKGIKKYGLQLSLIKGITTISGSVSNIFLFHFLGSPALAIFSIAIAPTEQIRAQIRNLENLLLPKLSQENWLIPSLKNIIKKSLLLILIITLIVIIFIIIAPWFYKIFFPKYIEAVPYSQFIAPTLLITSFNIFLHNILISKKKIKEQKYLTALSVFSSFIIIIPFIYYFKINGLIISIYINKLLETLLMIYFLSKKPTLSEIKKFS